MKSVPGVVCWRCFDKALGSGTSVYISGKSMSTTTLGQKSWLNCDSSGLELDRVYQRSEAGGSVCSRAGADAVCFREAASGSPVAKASRGAVSSSVMPSIAKSYSRVTFGVNCFVPG